MHELYKLERTCREAYRQFDFAQGMSIIVSS